MGKVVVLVAALAAVVIVVLAAYLVFSAYLGPHPTVRRVCEVVGREPIKELIKLNEVTSIEVIKGVKEVRECRLIESIPYRFCYGTSEGTKCVVRYRVKVLKTWRNETVAREELTKVRVDLSEFTEVYREENARPTYVVKGKHLETVVGVTFFDPTKDYWRGYVVPKDEVVFNGTKEVVRYVCGHKVVFEVPVMLSKNSRTGYLVPHERNPTYMEKVIAPTLKYLIQKLRICNTKPEKKALAIAIKEIIEESGYNYERHSRSDIDFLLNGGECSDYASYAYFLAKTFKLHAIGVASSLPGGSHDTAFLCEPWWKNRYGLELRLRNGSVVMCYLWVDTGAAIQWWSVYRVSEMNIFTDAATGKVLPVINVTKIS